LDDLVIARPDGSPTYNFSVVVDDIDMSITHVIRGDDHVNNTPRQVNVFRALGAELPVFAHVPMIIGTDGQRLSKRHGAVSVLQYRDDGFLPEALLNYLVRLGWSYGDQEVFSVDEMVRAFDVGNVNRAASAFDLDKLKWLNQHYVKAASTDRLVSLFVECLDQRGIDITEGPDPADVVEALRERAQTLQEMVDRSEYFYREFEDYDTGAAQKHLRPVAQSMLEDVRVRLEEMSDWTAEGIHQQVNATVAEAGSKLGKLAQPLRVAVSGTAATPPIDQTLLLVGRERTLGRINRALAFIDRRSASNA
ncbi:MAG: glutamate--tRNA ligase, partial [Arenicellales bacterium]|nr:glutamate--tRNA ligase [Arenicellales bacterium]